MKTLRALALAFASASLVACASAPKVAPAAPAPAAPSTEPAAPAAADAPAPGNAEPSAPAPVSAPAQASATPDTAKTDAKDGLDPLAVGGDLESSAVPKIVYTPKKELRAKTRGDLDAALASLAKETSLDGAVKKLTARLGKPTWVENGKKRVWIAKDGKSCHRFVLDADGQMNVETASADEWRMLSALTQENACTGEIRRGVSH